MHIGRPEAVACLELTFDTAVDGIDVACHCYSARS